MSNPNNVFNIVGRAAAAPVKFNPNDDGSYGVGLTVYADNSFKSKKTGKRESEVIQLNGFVPKDQANQATVYDYINKGDLIAVSGRLGTDVYVKNGETVYKPVNKIERISLHSTRKEQEARGITTGQTAQNQNQAPAQAEAPAPQANQAPAAQAPAAAPAPQAAQPQVQAQPQLTMDANGNLFDAAGNYVGRAQM